MAWKSGVAKAGKTCGNEVRSCFSAPLSSAWGNIFIKSSILSTFINECILGQIKHLEKKKFSPKYV